MNKITLITGSLPPIKCGVGFYSQKLLENFYDKGIKDIEVISTIGTNRTPYGIKTVRDWKIRSLSNIIKIIKSTRPNTVHIQYPAVGYKRELGINFLPYLIRLLLPSSKLILTLHEYHESRTIGKLRNIITSLPVHAIIVSNDKDKDSLPGILRKKTVIIPIGSNIKKIDLVPGEDLLKNNLDKLGLKNFKKTLLFFGFSSPNKRLESIIEILKSENMKDFQILLLTELNQDNIYHKKLINIFNNFNIGDKRIAWTGYLPDDQVSKILQRGQYFILPQSRPLSAKSGTAIAAITHNLIMISSGGDIVTNKPFQNNINSLLVWPPNAKNFSSAIVGAEQNKVLSSKIKIGADELSKYFSWDHITQMHEMIYEIDKI